MKTGKQRRIVREETEAIIGKAPRLGSLDNLVFFWF